MRSDFEKAIEHMGKVTRFVSKGSLREAESYLKSDEEVLNVETVNFNNDPGILVVTDKRVFFALKILAKNGFIQLPYSEIKAVSVEPIMRRMRIETNLKSFNIEAIHKKRCKDVHRNIMERI